MADQPFRFGVWLYAPKPVKGEGKYEKAPSLNINGTDFEDFEEAVTDFFGEESFDDLRALFDLGRAAAVIENRIETEDEDEDEEEEEEDERPRKKKGKKGKKKGRRYFGACPECEDGKLVRKQGTSRKTGEDYDFVACTNYPDCDYVLDS